MQYERNDIALAAGHASACAATCFEMQPAYEESAYRISIFGDEVETITHFDPLTGEVLGAPDQLALYPATHYVTPTDNIERALREIREELEAAGPPVRGRGQARRGAAASASAPSTTWR